MLLIFTRIEMADAISQSQKRVFVAGNVEHVIAVFARFKQEIAALGGFDIGGNSRSISFLGRRKNGRIAKIIFFVQIYGTLMPLGGRLHGSLQFFVQLRTRLGCGSRINQRNHQTSR